MSDTPTNDTRIRRRYRIETPMPLEQAAEMLAGEQSSGTFVALPDETPEITNRHRARVERIVELGSTTTQALPGCRTKSDIIRIAEITVSWPLENVGFNLPTLLATVAGNLYELAQFSGLKLLSIDLPEVFGKAFRGPAFGVEGTRALTSVQRRPLIGTIIKPSVGLTIEATAQLVDQLVGAGLDFLKDDELLANPPYCPIEKRIDAVMDVINRHADRTGRKAMFAFNITDELDAMQRHYDHIARRGGTCAMLSLNWVGLAATKKIADRGQLAIHGHRNGWGMFTRCPSLGMEYPAFVSIYRLAGVDQLHVNGIANKFWEPDDSVVASMEACLRIPPGQTRRALPVVSSGQWGGQAPETYRRTKTVDLLYQAGGGIMAHPSGPVAGVRALQQAWEAAVSGIDLDTYARTHSELRQSIQMFGKKA
ncbi:MAG: ribulose-bisphosphate carboxylase large subunit family protein [Tepidisphaeraceae bacterium]